MSKKLLLADDSITIQKVIGITFANEDYEMVVVDNGDAALQKAQEGRPDLILADVYMPGKNGYELCSAVKGDPALQGVPVLLLAGTFEPFDEDKARSVAADDWISKPFESQALIEKVEALLAGTASAPQAAAPPVAPSAPAPQPTAPAAPAPPPVVPEPAAAPEPAPAMAEEPASGDIWGDMGSEDIFAEETPAAPAVAAEPAAPAAPVQPQAHEIPVEDDLWGAALQEDDLAEEPAVAPSGDQEDDLWGALDEEMEEPAVAAVPEDDFDFAEEPSAQFDAPAPEVSGNEDILSLDEDDILAAEDVELIEEPDDIDADAFDFDDNSAEGGTPEPDQVDLGAEPAPVASTGDEMDWGDVAEPSEMNEMYDSFEEDLTPPEMPASQEAAPAPPPAPEPSPAVAPAAAAAADTSQVEQMVAAMSEEQLNAIVEKVATSMLEKIAWEVVPDLAENLIKEELRKIREEAD